MNNLRLFRRKLENLRREKRKNLRLYREFKQTGCNYIVNLITNELHRVDLENFWGSHNLVRADLHSFIGLINRGIRPAHFSRDGKTFHIYNVETGELIGDYVLNKCKHCFSH